MLIRSAVDKGKNGELGYSLEDFNRITKLKSFIELKQFYKTLQVKESRLCSVLFFFATSTH